MRKILIFLYIILTPVIALSSCSGKGSGTKDDPYQITNLNQLQEMNDEHEKWSFFILMNDIDATETKNWNYYDHDNNPDTPDIPGGFVPIIFQKFENFDGKYHIIKNLYINRPAHAVGLFGLILSSESSIQNVGLVDCDINGGRAGSFCGQLLGGNFLNCYSTGKVKGTYVGGFCAEGELVNFYQCYTECTVTASKEASSFLHGVSTLGQIHYCYATGKTIGTKVLPVFGSEYMFLRGAIWDIETTGSSFGGHGSVGLTTKDMMNHDTLDKYLFNFDLYWCLDDGKKYPKIKGFADCPTDTYFKEPISGIYKLNIEPNPFGDKAEIKYTLPKQCSVTIELVNVFGILQKEIVNNTNHLPGSHKISFDASDLPSGVYFCTLKTPHFTNTKKMVIIK